MGSDGSRAQGFPGVQKPDPGSLQAGPVLLMWGTVGVLVGSILHHLGLSLPDRNQRTLGGCD